MSFLGKKWVLKTENHESNLFELLLQNRGIKSEAEKEEYLSEGDLHDPFLFQDMEKAVERVKKAISNEERVIVFGDYDVDGISGTALLVHTLKKLGAAVSYRLPNRTEDGYGLSDKFIDVFEEAGAKLIITVDCGISNGKQIQNAQEKGIDVIITDHHTVPAEKPQAFAIIHPLVEDETYPFKGLTGSGVAFKLAQALYQAHDLDSYDELLDLASLGTVADMGPLKGENRLIVKKGLKFLQNSKWEGLELLKKIAKIKENVDTDAIGFQICPRINAAGRISSPYIALQLLLHESEQENSRTLAKQLEELNLKRRQLTQDALDELNGHISELNEPKIIIKSSPNWHVGIVGLIAGRVADQHGVPAIILQDFGDYLVASCRSPEFFNVTEALSAHKELLDVYGGHAQAAGFTIQKANFNEFIEKMNEYVENKLKDQDLRPKLMIDCELPENFLDLSTIELVNRMQPFGIDNEKPLFKLSDCEVEHFKQVGSSKSHLKIRLKKGEKYLDAIAFSFGEAYEHLREHQKIDVAAYLECNTWNGKDHLQLRIADLNLSKD